MRFLTSVLARTALADFFTQERWVADIIPSNR